MHWPGKDERSSQIQTVYDCYLHNLMISILLWATFSACLSKRDKWCIASLGRELDVDLSQALLEQVLRSFHKWWLLLSSTGSYQFQCPRLIFLSQFITREFERKIKAVFSSFECESTELLRFLSLSDLASPSLRWSVRVFLTSAFAVLVSDPAGPSMRWSVMVFLTSDHWRRGTLSTVSVGRTLCLMSERAMTIRPGCLFLCMVSPIALRAFWNKILEVFILISSPCWTVVILRWKAPLNWRKMRMRRHERNFFMSQSTRLGV